jgi:hypothetical protein
LRDGDARAPKPSTQLAEASLRMCSQDTRRRLSRKNTTATAHAEAATKATVASAVQSSSPSSRTGGGGETCATGRGAGAAGITGAAGGGSRDSASPTEGRAGASAPGPLPVPGSALGGGSAGGGTVSPSAASTAAPASSAVVTMQDSLPSAVRAHDWGGKTRTDTAAEPTGQRAHTRTKKAEPIGILPHMPAQPRPKHTTPRSLLHHPGPIITAR